MGLRHRVGRQDSRPWATGGNASGGADDAGTHRAVPGRRTRAAALHLIAVVVVAATATAFIQSYDALYQWASRYLSDGWARTWPLQVDAWIVVGELSLYVGYRDRWPARRKIWSWLAALTGLLVSTVFNVGHMAADVDIAGHVTAAVPPVAAFAGLSVGLQVLKYVEEARDQSHGPTPRSFGAADPTDRREYPSPARTAIERHDRRPSRDDRLAAARAALTETPNLTGEQLGELLNVSDRTGRRLIRKVATTSQGGNLTDTSTS